MCLTTLPSMMARRSTTKISRHLIDMIAFNAFLLYEKSGGKHTHLEFRIELEEKLIVQNQDDSSRPNQR